MATEAVNHYRVLETTAKIPIAPGIERYLAMNSAISSVLYMPGVKFQLFIWSVLNNRFDALIGLALTLFKFVLQRRTEKIRRNKRC